MIKELDKLECCEVHGNGPAVVVLSGIAAVCTSIAASMHIQGSGLSGKPTVAVGNPAGNNVGNAVKNVHDNSEGCINLTSGVFTLVAAVCGAVAAGLKATGY